ncbi:MAG: HD domain-containing phosphohydrolase [Acidobacteriota bacterium]
MSNILVVNPNRDQAKSLAAALSARGGQVNVAGTIQEALQILARTGHEQMVSVRRLPDGSGELLAQQAAEVSPRTVVSLITNFADIKGPADILRFDFTDYIISTDGLAGLVCDSSQGPAPHQRALVDCFLRTVEAVVGLVELSDPLAVGSAASSMRLAEGVCREMGLQEVRRQEVGLAALLHDLGNFTMSPEVLDKVGPLAPEEEEAIRQHALRGVQLLDHIDFPWRIKPIILHHHERYDGTGYPDGKKGRAIPIGARILAVVDSYLAMTTRRPHRKSLSHAKAFKEIRAHVGTQFDPEVVEAFSSFVERRKKMAGDLFQVKVLVVGRGGEPFSRMKLHFLREDFCVLDANCLEEAVESVKKEDVRFMLADITQEWDEGLRLLDAMQGRIEVSKTDVFFFDGDGSRERRVTALDNGAEEVYPPDVSPQELISRMRRILRKEAAVRKGTLGREKGGIEGMLSEMSLPELLQMMNMGQKTARVEVRCKGISGKIFLESGRLTHAEAGDKEGQPALVDLLRQEEGRFRILHGVTTPRRSIDRDAMSVLLDTLRTMDEDGRAGSSPSA